MNRLVTFVIGFALTGGLSCALRPPVARVPELPSVAAAPPTARSAADEVEALLARHLTGLAPFEVRRVAEALITEANRNRVEPALVLAVVHTESGYYNFARSSVGALGLMQIMPATGEMLAREAGIPWTGPEMLFEPELNLRLGTRYLATLHVRYGDWRRALAAYNWGPGAIDRRLAEGEGLPEQYTDRVYARLARK
jgi:soluble lytic murein transglycosylase